jgi:excisionase family DNA binding protein
MNLVMNKKILTKRGLSEYLGISSGKIDLMMKSGLVYVKFGRNVRFDMEDVNEYMNNNKR